MKKKIVYRIISIVSLIIAVSAIAAIVVIFLMYQQSSREYEELLSQARTGIEDASTAQPEQPEDTQEPDDSEETLASIPINFDYIKGVNDDIIGWIEVDGTVIDYPILFDDTPNTYYLKHNYSGSYTPYGSIFVLGCNAADFSDFNTIIYGHNMINGSMFAQLHKFRKQEFFDEHDTIIIYTPDRKLTYKIFGAYRTDNLNVTLNNDFSTSELRQEYLDRVYAHTSRSIFNPDVEVTPEDRIVTLSTCGSSSATRFFVQGVLISDEEGHYSAR